MISKLHKIFFGILTAIWAYALFGVIYTVFIDGCIICGCGIILSTVFFTLFVESSLAFIYGDTEE
jgi:hypothetical protein